MSKFQFKRSSGISGSPFGLDLGVLASYSAVVWFPHTQFAGLCSKNLISSFTQPDFLFWPSMCKPKSSFIINENYIYKFYSIFFWDLIQQCSKIYVVGRILYTITMLFNGTAGFPLKNLYGVLLTDVYNMVKENARDSYFSFS